MRQPANAKNSDVKKAPLKVEGISSIRPPIKKIYCVKCQKLVKGQMQSPGGITRVICPRCNQSLRVWNSLVWRSVKNGATAVS